MARTSELETYLETAKQKRLPYEKQWLLNTAFYQGNQWVYYDAASRQLRKPSVPSYRVLLVSNQVQPTIRTEFGKVTANKPKFFVVPASADGDDVKKAKVSEMILEHNWYIANIGKKLRSTVLWALVAGTGFVKVYWDSTAGDRVTDETTGASFNIGEVAVDIVSPFELYIDPHATCMENARWAIQQKVRSADYVLGKYGKKFEEHEINATALTGTPTLSIDGSLSMKGLVVSELWEKPSKKHPQGRFAVWVDEEKILDGPHPYEHKKLPFHMMGHIEVPGKFYYDSITTQLIPIQMEYNKTRSQIIETKNQMSKPKWLVPYGALQEGDEITSAPGEIITYRNGLKPEAWTPPAIPNYVMQEIERNLEDIKSISGINDVSRGEVPPNLRSGVAISFLQEQDNSRLSTTVDNYENLVASVCKDVLLLAAQFYEEPRIVRVVGSDRQAMAKEITAVDFQGAYDVKVEAGSTLPQSKAAKQDFLIQLWQYKIVDDPKLLLKLLDFGGVEGAYNDFEVDFNQVDRENDRLMQGEPLMAHDFDNHWIHLAEHNKFRKTAQFEQLDPTIQATVNMHCQQHMEMQQMAQAQMPGMIEGGVPGAPGTPGQDGQQPPVGNPQDMPPQMPGSELPPM